MTVLTKAVIAYSSGILISYNCSTEIGTKTLSLCLMLLLIILLLSLRYPTINTAGICLAIIVFAILQTSSRLDFIESTKRSQSQLLNKELKLTFELTKEINAYVGRKFIAKVLSVGDQQLGFGPIYCILNLNIPSDHISITDNILIHGRLKLIKAQMNPYVRDIRSYYARRNIHLVCYADPDKTQIIKTGSQNRVLSLGRLREDLSNRIERLIPRKDQQGIIQSMILGERSKLDLDTLSKFSKAGAVHILAISGLHIGILFSIINSILLPMQLSDRLSILRSIMTISMIWGYTFLVSAPVSALRACTMLSLYIIARLLNHISSAYNIVSCTALCILYSDPLELFDLSFQFSFLALTGILYFKDRLFVWVPIEKSILKLFVQLISVSVSAQILLFPFIIHYFNKFPNYFWLSNIIAIAFSYIGISLSILILVLDSYACIRHDQFHSLFADSLSYITDKFINFLSAISDLSYSLTDNIYYPLPSLVILSCMIILLMILISYKYAKTVWIIAMSFLLFNLYLFIHKRKTLKESKIYIHHCNYGSLINHIHAGRSTELFCTIDDEYKNYLSDKLKLASYVREDLRIKAYKKNLHFKIDGNDVLIYPDDRYLKELHDTEIQLLVLDRISFESLRSATSQPLVHKVIVDAGCDLESRTKIKSWCQRNSIAFHDTNRSGCYSKILSNQ